MMFLVLANKGAVTKSVCVCVCEQRVSEGENETGRGRERGSLKVFVCESRNLSIW